MSNKKHVVYLITNLVNHKKYVGVSCRFEKRLKEHSRANTVIGRAIRKYGLESFTIEVLFTGEREECYGAEDAMITEHGSRHSEGGYNILEGGDVTPRGATFRVWTQEQRDRVREKMMGNRYAAGHQNGKGIPRTDMVKEKIRNSKKLNPYQWSDEEKERIRAQQLGKVRSQNTKDEISRKLKESWDGRRAVDSVCIIQDCLTPSRSKGLCRRHYFQDYRAKT